MKYGAESPAEIITRILEQRRTKNSSYSVSALARDIGVSQSLLSRVLSGKRKLTLAQAQRMVLLLNLNKNDERKLIDATLKQSSEKISSDRRIRNKLESMAEQEPKRRERHLESEKFTAIAKWYHLPLLTLLSTKGFRNDARWISKRLGILPIEAENAIDRLKLLGLIEEKDGTLVETNGHVEVMPKKSEEAVREHHAQMMNKAKEVMGTDVDHAAWEMREISSLSMGVDTKNVKDAKELIRKFQQDMRTLLTKGSADEVYQFNVQLFPISRSPK